MMFRHSRCVMFEDWYATHGHKMFGHYIVHQTTFVYKTKFLCGQSTNIIPTSPILQKETTYTILKWN